MTRAVDSLGQIGTTRYVRVGNDGFHCRCGRLYRRLPDGRLGCPKHPSRIVTATTVIHATYHQRPDVYWGLVMKQNGDRSIKSAKRRSLQERRRLNAIDRLAIRRAAIGG